MINIKRMTDDTLLAAPKRATEGAAGYDLRAAIDGVIQPGHNMLIPTGFAWALPFGVEGKLEMRSGLAKKYKLAVLAGVIDSDYRGEVFVNVINLGKKSFEFSAHDRIAQLIPRIIRTDELNVVETLDDTQRGEGRFGHTGMR